MLVIDISVSRLVLASTSVTTGDGFNQSEQSVSTESSSSGLQSVVLCLLRSRSVSWLLELSVSGLLLLGTAAGSVNVYNLIRVVLEGGG